MPELSKTRKSEESLQPPSQHVIELLALAEVLLNDKKILFAHTVQRASTQMTRLEATIRKQDAQLKRYQIAARVLKQLGEEI